MFTVVRGARTAGPATPSAQRIKPTNKKKKPEGVLRSHIGLYQNKKFNIRHSTPTITASSTGRSYQTTPDSPGISVKP